MSSQLDCDTQMPYDWQCGINKCGQTSIHLPSSSHIIMQYCGRVIKVWSSTKKGYFAAEKAMTIAADSCIYTNHNFVTETLKNEAGAEV